MYSLVKLVHTMLEIGSPISINSNSTRVSISYLHACSASLGYNSFFCFCSNQWFVAYKAISKYYTAVSSTYL